MSAPTYDYWQNALAGNFGPVHEGDPQPGFYRRRLVRNGPFVPVAIWNDGNAMLAKVSNDMVDAADLWSWVCDKPITHEEYNRVMAGGSWSDEPKVSAPATGNMPSDPFEALTVEWQGEKEVGEEILSKPITTQDQANQAAVYTKRVAGVAKKATDHHKVEKQPHLDAGRTVDDKWRDLKEEPVDMGKRVKRHMDAFLLDQQRKERERQEAARREEERLRREAEEAARQASQADDGAAKAEAERLQKEADAKAKEAEARNAQAGRTGAKVSLRSFVSGQITDFDALLMALKDRPEIQELVQTLANRAAKSGVELPGMCIVTEQRAA